MSLRILIIGSGGREHALAWKLQQSPLTSHIYVVPGNGGTAALGPNVENVDISPDNFDSLVKFAVDNGVRLVVPGPEQPLVDGVVDYFRAHAGSIQVFGPSKAAARMEGSKAFSKDFMRRHDIPTAAYQIFQKHDEAQTFLESHQDTKWVLKASGLAGGKGVILPNTHKEATEALASIMLDKEFGEAGDSVVIEELLEGEELSILSFTDGHTIRSLPAAQDHKRINDGDQGPNTGGMGCYSPTGVMSPELLQRIERETLQPTIDGMRQERCPFVGLLFTGFMITKNGPKVLEYNCRFGDPETQTLLPLLDGDLVELMLSCCGGWLDALELKIKETYSTTVVIAAGGYPGMYQKGTIMDVKEPAQDTYIFHAGTNLDPTTQTLKSSGGRVIASTATGPTIQAAVEKAYKGVSCISFSKMHYRRDIAYRALNRQTIPSGVPSATIKDDSPLTYAAAGVSITNGDSLVSEIKASVKKTARLGACAIIGGFGGEIDLAAAGYPADSPTIVACIDGIGTKILIGIEMGNYFSVGIDLVAMNTNDLVVAGAEPLAFLDYYACSYLDVPSAASFVQGVAEGCIRSGCALVGGETAEMPSLYKKGDFDAGGCAIGALAYGLKMLPDTNAMQIGDVLLGLASSGPHSNGYSLIRRIVERSGLKYSDPAPWEESGAEQKSVGNALLEPTRIYVNSLLSVLPNARSRDKRSRILGISHITGGGLGGNVPRMLPDHLAAEMNIGSWEVPSVLRWLKREGRMDNLEFSRTFNTGLGIVLVVSEQEADGMTKDLEKAGERVYRIGKLVERKEKEEGCVLNGLEAWNEL